MRRKSLYAAIACVMLVLCMGMGKAWAYFTDTSMATGGIPVKTGTTIEEEYGPGTKYISITNTSSAAVWVRARVYASAILEPSASGGNWSGDSTDDWFEYTEMLEPQAVTEKLVVEFGFDKLPEPSDGDQVSVIIVYEEAPVQYDSDGNPLPPQWN